MQIDPAARIPVCRQQGGANHDVMLRSVHMTEGQMHHLFDDRNGILCGFCLAQADDGIEAAGMAVIAYIVPMHTSGLAVLFFVADLTFHLFVRLEIDKRRPADQTFFFHCYRSLQ